MIPDEFFKLLIFVLRQMYNNKTMTLPFSNNNNIVVVVVVVVALAEDHNMDRLYNLLAEPQDHCMQHGNHCMQLEKRPSHKLVMPPCLHHSCIIMRTLHSFWRWVRYTKPE